MSKEVKCSVCHGTMLWMAENKTRHVHWCHQCGTIRWNSKLSGKVEYRSPNIHKD